MFGFCWMIVRGVPVPDERLPSADTSRGCWTLFDFTAIIWGDDTGVSILCVPFLGEHSIL